jgi:hypothetical protein
LGIWSKVVTKWKNIGICRFLLPLVSCF